MAYEEYYYKKFFKQVFNFSILEEWYEKYINIVW